MVYYSYEERRDVIKVEITAHYNDTNRNIQESHTVTLSDGDGYQLVDNWWELPAAKRSEKLFALADVLLIAQGIRKGFRFEEAGMKQIAQIMRDELSD